MFDFQVLGLVFEFGYRCYNLHICIAIMPERCLLSDGIFQAPGETACGFIRFFCSASRSSP